VRQRFLPVSIILDLNPMIQTCKTKVLYKMQAFI
jgi:hypothetical protein